MWLFNLFVFFIGPTPFTCDASFISDILGLTLSRKYTKLSLVGLGLLFKGALSREGDPGASGLSKNSYPLSLFYAYKGLLLSHFVPSFASCLSVSFKDSDV